MCCPDGHFGKNCEQCPGLSEKADVCFGKGSCHVSQFSLKSWKIEN